MNEWQPIETAPKDGTWILLAGGKVEDDEDEFRMAIAKWTNYLSGRTTDWHWQHCFYDGGYYGSYDGPTHWMPLPEPPK